MAAQDLGLHFVRPARVSQEIKNDLDAAYRAVDMALAGLDLGGKRRPEGQYSLPEQKHSLVRSTVSQKFDANEMGTNRLMDRIWPEDGQLSALPEALSDTDQLQPLQYHLRQVGQGQLFQAIQSTPSPAGGCSDFLGPVNVLNGDRYFAPDRDREGNVLGDDSHIETGTWDGFCYSPQQQGGVGYTTDYIQSLLSQDKGVQDFQASVGRNAAHGLGIRSGIQSGFVPFQVGACGELERGCLPCFPFHDVDQSLPGVSLMNSLKLHEMHSSGVTLPDSLESMDDGEETWQNGDVPDVYAHGNATDPKTKSEQAMLLAITGILKCAVEGNLAHKDVMSDLYFLIVTVRRHLEEYQNLTPEAAETLLLICSTLPTACKCARFDAGAQYLLC